MALLSMFEIQPLWEFIGWQPKLWDAYYTYSIVQCYFLGTR